MNVVEIKLSPDVALRLLAGEGCEQNTKRTYGQCFFDGRNVLARYGADMPCTACIAALALGWVKWPTDEK